jgi:multiple sugar transport system ATP-binding protein
LIVAGISYRDLTKIFEGGTVAVDGIDLEVKDGELMVLVGPSGSGKTTVLRMTAGLEDPTGGEIRIGERVVNDLPPKDRNIAMVFQDYALYPHMSVYKNMAFGLKLHGVDKHEISRRVNSSAAMLGISDLLRRKPAKLSGGQRQRVAMGRAIVREPDVFLMDEPLSNLDAKLRVEMRAYVAMLQQQLGTTTLYVTHDQTEAMTMGNRVAVLRDGRIQQCDEPQQLYDKPANMFVAGFIGSPAMNLIHSAISAKGGVVKAELGDTEIRLTQNVLDRHANLPEYVGKDVVLGIRPEDMEDAELVPSGKTTASIDVMVALAEPMGADIIVHFPIEGVEENVDSAASERPSESESPESAVGAATSGPVVAEENRQARFTARLSPRSRARSRARLRLVIDLDRLHFFDPDTGIKI